MIRNIVFDMGQVLKKFDPIACIAPYVEDPEEIEMIRAACFASPEWKMLDAGEIRYADALIRWKKRLPGHLHGKLEQIVENWDYTMTDIPGMTELVKALADAGYRIYLLSNVSVRFDRIRKNFPALRFMSGCVISAEEKLVKPDPRIYRVLLDRYGLIPDESVFVDDLPANASAAESVGMHSIVFDGLAVHLIRSLNAIGITADLSSVAVDGSMK